MTFSLRELIFIIIKSLYYKIQYYFSPNKYENNIKNFQKFVKFVEDPDEKEQLISNYKRNRSFSNIIKNQWLFDNYHKIYSYINRFSIICFLLSHIFIYIYVLFLDKKIKENLWSAEKKLNLLYYLFYFYYFFLFP